MMLKALYLVRHGESEWNASRRIQGQRDSKLSPAGRRQARALFCRLRNERLDAVYASDLSRAAETALIATGWKAADIRFSPDLREVSFGEWEGLSPEKVRQRYPAEWEAFRRDPVHSRPKTGESFSDLSERVRGFLALLHAGHAGQSVLAVTHGGPIRMALIQILGMPPNNWRTLRVANTGLTKVEFCDDGPRLSSFDTTGHLCLARKARPGGEDDV